MSGFTVQARTNMEIQDILRLIFVFTAVTRIQLTTAIICYECDNDPIATIYDPNCGNLDYNDPSKTEESDNPDYTCEIIMWEDGYVTRGLYEGEVIQDDGDCIEGAVMKKCFCEGDLCNTDSFCNQCGDIITEGTTTATPTEPTTETETTTAKPTTPATEPPPTGTLECYSCEDCKTVDDNTNSQIDEIFKMCFTTIELETGEVNRGGTKNEHPDGECLEPEESIVCWCSTSLCNNTPY